MQLDPFLKACQELGESLVEKGVLIITRNLKLLHTMQENLDKIIEILK